MLTLKAGLKWLHRGEDSLLILALLSMLLISVVQIGLRNFADDGIFWAETFLRILVLWVAMLGAMVATRESSHISIDILSRYLHSKFIRILQLFTHLFSAVICAIVAYHSLEYIKLEYEDQTVAFASVPTWFCQAIIPFGFIVMSLRFVINGVLALFNPNLQTGVSD